MTVPRGSYIDMVGPLYSSYTLPFRLFLKLLQPFAVDLDAAGVGLRQGVLLEDTAHVVEQTGDAQEHIGRSATVLLLEKRFGIGITLHSGFG